MPANPQVGFFALSNAADHHGDADVRLVHARRPERPAGPELRAGQRRQPGPVITAADASQTFGVAPLAVNFTVRGDRRRR